MFICLDFTEVIKHSHLQTESYVSETSLSFLGFCSRYYCIKSQVKLQATCHWDRDKFVLSRGRYGISLGYVLAGYPWDSSVIIPT